jgi:hypothetical protein
MIRHERELPDPLELIVKGHDDHLIGYACPKCGAVFLVAKRSDPKMYEARKEDERNHAAEHCVKDCVCGKLIDRSYRLRCDACLAQMDADKEQKLFEKSKKLTIEEYDGPVYWEGRSGDMGDGYFSDVEALLDHCESEGMDPPDYVWTCDKNEMKLDAESIIENAVSEMYEDAFDSIPKKALDSLQAYLDVWCQEVNIVSWHDNHATAVLLREPEEPALTG